MFVGVLDMTSLAHYETQWGWLLTATWSVSTANDWTITATLVVLLYKQRANVFKRYGLSMPSYMSSITIHDTQNRGTRG
jgi:hypothetical protein